MMEAEGYTVIHIISWNTDIPGPEAKRGDFRAGMLQLEPQHETENDSTCAHARTKVNKEDWRIND